MVLNAYPAVTTGPRLLKILIARRDEYRDRDSDLAATAKLNCLEATAHSGLPQTLDKVAHWIIASNFGLHIPEA